MHQKDFVGSEQLVRGLEDGLLERVSFAEPKSWEVGSVSAPFATARPPAASSAAENPWGNLGASADEESRAAVYPLCRH